MIRAASLILLLPITGAVTASAAAESGAPSIAELENLAYAGIGDEPVTLVDGQWLGEPVSPGSESRSRVELVRDFRRTGDVGGDGKEKALVILTESSGGTGVFSYLAVVGRRDGRPVGLATAEVGDRVQIRDARVAAGKIELDVVQVGPDDAMCCPTQLATRVFSMSDAALREVSQQVTGSLGLDSLGGTEWVLTHFSRSEAAPREPAITLELRDGRLGGSSGCNRYFASPKAGDAPGAMSVGPVGGTRMACPEEIMTLETRYLQALQGVTGYGFANGRLSLPWSRDDASGTLLYEASR